MVDIIAPLLFITWAALLFGGFVFGKRWTDGTRRMPVWTRMASSLTLALSAWWFALRGQTASYAVLFAFGMTFGLLGDLFMARLIPVGQYVLGGMASFGIGHICYVVAIALMAAAFDLSFRFEALIAWWIIGVIGWLIAVWIGARERGVLRRAALPYALLLSTTTGLATALALTDARFALLALGAGLFLLSDLILAARLFRGTYFPLIDDVVWLTYGPGQMLIVFSSVAVLSPL